MSTLSQFNPRVRAKFSGAGNPDNHISGAKSDDVYRNTLSYELFTCQDPTIQQVWVGSQQGHIPITEANHPNLKAFYTGDHFSGTTILDLSSNGKNLTGVNVLTDTGKLGSSFLGDGTTRYGLTASPIGITGTTPRSACFWIKRDNPLTSGGKRVLLYGYTGPGVTKNAWNISVDSIAPGTVYLNFTGRDVYTTTQPLVQGQWQFVTVVTDGLTNDLVNDTHFYVDAVLQPKVGIGSESNTYNTNDNGLGFLGNTLDLNTFVDGHIDQFRFFNKALTTEEIAQLHNSGLGA